MYASSRDSVIAVSDALLTRAAARAKERDLREPRNATYLRAAPRRNAAQGVT